MSITLQPFTARIITIVAAFIVSSLMLNATIGIF